MKNTKLSLLMVLVLASCAVPTSPVPTQTLTPAPAPMSTQTPTQMPSPTPTMIPAPTQIGGGSGRLIFAHSKEEFKKTFPDLKGETHVFVANIDGTNKTPIASDLDIYNYLMDVSPDGTKALIVSMPNRKDTYAVLYMINLKSTTFDSIKLVDKVSIEKFHSSTAKWIDNSQIVYIGQGESGFGIYKTNVNENQPIVLVGNDIGVTPFQIRGVTNTQIYWDTEVLMRREGNRSSYAYNVYSTSLDGGETNPLEFNGKTVSVAHPIFGNGFALSPDGSKIAWAPSFFMFDDHSTTIYIAPISDINNPIRSIDPMSTSHLIWFPDGTKILNFDQLSLTSSTRADEDIFGIYEIPLSSDLPVRNYRLPKEVMFQQQSGGSMGFMKIYDMSPDGRQLIVSTLKEVNGSYESTYNILDLETFVLTEVNWLSLQNGVRWIP